MTTERGEGWLFVSILEGEDVTQEGTAEERTGLGLSQDCLQCGSLTGMFTHSHPEACLSDCRPAYEDTVSLKYSAYEPNESGDC